MIFESKIDSLMTFLIKFNDFSNTGYSTDCTKKTYDNFNTEICMASFFMSMTNLDKLGNNPSLANEKILLNSMDYETQRYFSQSNNFNFKSIMLIKYNHPCQNCGISVDNGLIFKTCTDNACNSQINNKTVPVDSTIYSDFTYEDPIYNFDRTIVNIEVFINSIKLDPSLVTIEDIKIGTNDAKRVSFTRDKNGLINLSYRVYYYNNTLAQNLPNNNLRVLYEPFNSKKDKKKLKYLGNRYDEKKNRLLQTININKDPELPDYLSANLTLDFESFIDGQGIGIVSLFTLSIFCIISACGCIIGLLVQFVYFKFLGGKSLGDEYAFSEDEDDYENTEHSSDSGTKPTFLKKLIKREEEPKNGYELTTDPRRNYNYTNARYIREKPDKLELPLINTESTTYAPNEKVDIVIKNGRKMRRIRKKRKG